MTMMEDLRDNERVPHWERGKDDKGFWHPGYEIDYCEKCTKPVIHSRMIKVNNCGRRKCND